MPEWMEELEEYRNFLRSREMSRNTIEKYVRDARSFLGFVGEDEISRGKVLEYKEYILSKRKVSSVNSMLTAVNTYLKWRGKEETCVRTCRVQKRIFREEGRELKKEEYYRLLRTASKENRERLAGILRTIASTGMRVGELSYLTVESLKSQQVEIHFKGKQRVILLSRSLVIFLRDYCRKNGIKSGMIFVTRNGHAVDRRNIWAEMKALCVLAGVQATKVFPHNLRHLFAKCFYEKEHDLARLADYLGHSSIETTRRYIMITSEEACAGELELGLCGIGMEEKEGGKESEKGERTI